MMAVLRSCAHSPKMPFTIAPAMAVRVNRCRELMMSGRFRKELRAVPATNPICTAKGSKSAPLRSSFHSLTNDGTTAESLNQSDIPSNSAIASRASVRHRADDGSEELSASRFTKEYLRERSYLPNDFAAPMRGKSKSCRDRLINTEAV